MRTRHILINLEENPLQLLLLAEWCASRGKAMRPECDNEQLFVYVKVSDGQLQEMQEYIQANSATD